VASSAWDNPLDFRHVAGCIAAQGSAILNQSQGDQVQPCHNDRRVQRNQTARMDNVAEPNWYLQDWMTHLGKIQASLVNELGWNKSRANLVWHARQQYTRATVNEVSTWLGIQPYELLMPPAEALQIRQVRDAAIAIAARVGAKAATSTT
jgi:hypothetical protein